MTVSSENRHTCDGYFILLVALLIDITGEPWEKCYYKLNALRGKGGALPDLDINKLNKDMNKRYSE